MRASVHVPISTSEAAPKPVSQRSFRPPSGHVFRQERKNGPVWYAKYRLPDGRQIQRKLGPAWTERGRPADGYFTKRQAENWLRDVLDQARRGVLPGMVLTGATFADAAAEFLRYVEHDRALKPSTLRGYRSIINAYLLPAFASRRIEDITTKDIELWRTRLTAVSDAKREPKDTDANTREAEKAPQRKLSNNSKNRIVILLHGVFARACKVYELPSNPVSAVERHPVRLAGDIDVFSPEEILALVRAAGSDQDGAVYLTAAFTGLRRGELIALRWRDVNFSGATIRVRASYAGESLTAPKSGKVRSVPMAPEVAQVLARLSQRKYFTADDDLVFVGESGSYLDGSALRRRYKKALEQAGLRPLRFHDLRHTFGTRMITKADIRRVQEWMGHADIQTTMRYLHYAPREEDAQLVAQAFEIKPSATQIAPVPSDPEKTSTKTA